MPEAGIEGRNYRRHALEYLLSRRRLPVIFERFRKRAVKGDASPEAAQDPAADSTEFLTGDPSVDRRSLQLLLDTMAEVGSTIELDRLLVDLVDKSIEATRSERGFLLLLGPAAGGEPQIEVRVARGLGGREIPLETTYSTSVAKKVLTTGEPVANIVQSSQDALDLGQSVYDLKLRAVMCVPLAARGQLSGAIYVDSRAERKEFTGRDLAFFAALAQQLSVSLENARLYNESLERVRLSKELELAQRIQEQLLPKPTGLPDDIEVHTWFQAAEAASADTFDVIARDDGSVACLLGDVSGHGIASALIAHSVQAALRSYLEVLDDPGEVICRLNARFTAGIEPGNFMSMLIARLWRDGEPHRLSYVNAGHGCSWLIRQEGVTSLEMGGPALGMVPGYEYRSAVEPKFEKGDVLFLCSDGVTEARNTARDLLGEARVLAILERSHGKGAEALIQDVRATLLAHTGEAQLEDDVMLLALSLCE